MRHHLAIAIALLAALAAPAAVRADEASGPDRETLFQKPWGTIYHLPLPPGVAVIQDMLGEYVISSHGENTVVMQEGKTDGCSVQFWDRSELAVTVDGHEVRVLCHGKWSYLRRSYEGWTAKLPDDTITLRQHGHEVTIEGKRGKTIAVEGPLGFVVTSGSGESRYEREGDGPFKFSGLPIEQHPYVQRGVYFEQKNFGAFIDFKLAERSRAFTLIDWSSTPVEK
jgi:hypothetical protein